MTESEFQEFIITIGYRYNEKSKTAFNSFEGFHTRIEFIPKENRYVFLLSSGVKSQSNIIEIKNKLKTFSSQNKNSIIRAFYKNKTINITLKMTVDSEIDKDNLKQTAKLIMELCKSEKIIPICSVCSKKRTTGLYVIGRQLVPVCDFCIKRKRRQYEYRKNVFDLKTQNMPAGIAGAIFGALFGATIYVLLYQIMPMFGIGTLFITLLSFIGFVVVGQRATKKSAVICMIISFLVLIASEYISIAANMAILIEQKGGGIAVSEAIQATNMSFMDFDFMFSSLMDIAVGTVIIILSGIIYFLKRKYTRPLKISQNVL